MKHSRISWRRVAALSFLMLTLFAFAAFTQTETSSTVTTHTETYDEPGFDWGWLGLLGLLGLLPRKAEDDRPVVDSSRRI